MDDSTADLLKLVLQITLGGAGAVALFFTAAQLATRRRAHLLEVYRQVFDMCDAPEIRAARHYVYGMDRNAFKTEDWASLSAGPPTQGTATPRQHRDQAERLARTFDQLGLLVREGRIPINIVARFYASPLLRCWHQLAPYIQHIRSPDGRNQPGHMWEWEHLVTAIVIPNLQNGKGTWKGVSAHDHLEQWVTPIKRDHSMMLRDSEYKPAGHIWEIASWYKFWRW